MAHDPDSVHGKLDRILLLIEDKDVGLMTRVSVLEKTIVGTADNPGLCEQVRAVKNESSKHSALVSSGISAAIIVLWEMARRKIFGD